METPLSSSARKVQDALSQMGLSCRVIELPASTRTAQEAAQAAGCTLGQIVKSLVFRTRNSGQPVLVETSGANRVDEKRVAALLGEPVDKASADFVREQTGFAIGGVPPLAHDHPIRTLIDEDLMQYDLIWAAAGTPNAIFQLTPADLQRMTGGQVAAVRQEL